MAASHEAGGGQQLWHHPGTRAPRLMRGPLAAQQKQLGVYSKTQDTSHAKHFADCP